MSSFITLLLLLCLFLHACSARRLGLVDHKETRKQVHLLTQDVENASLNKISIPSELSSSIGESWDSAITMKQKASKGFLNEIKEAIQGYKMIIISSQNDLQLHMAKTEGLKRQRRSMLESPLNSDTEEIVDSKENNTVEDVVVMDYAQPHRKPPIHNEKP